MANDTVRNFFFHNVPGPGGGRRFEEVGMPSGIAYADGRPRGGMGIDAAEVQPGLFAVVIANFSDEPNSLFKLTRARPVLFHDIAAEAGLAGESRPPMKFGALFLDYDLDGRLDLFTANGHLEPDIAVARPRQSYPQPAQLFRNTGRLDGLFAPVPSSGPGGSAFPPMVGRGCAYLDYDGDGSPDLVVTENGGPARLYRNDNRTGNRYLRHVLVQAAHNARYLPNCVLASAMPTDMRAAETIALLADRPSKNGKATAYVCQNFACQAPVTTPEELARLL